MEKTAQEEQPFVDGHLDLAENVTLFGRNLTLEVQAIRAVENRIGRQATVSLPALERGGVAVAFATVTPGFLAADVGPNFEPRSAIYRTSVEAEAQALIQVGLYESWEQQGRVRLIKTVDDLEQHLRLWRGDRKPGLVLLMEGADPIVKADDLPRWWARGLRMIGLTFGDTRYGRGVAGGSARPAQGGVAPGGLTPDGCALLSQMAEKGFIWDISHLTEEGVWQGLDLVQIPVCASHANAQALIPTNRHLSDAVIRAVASRNGVVGLVLYNGFLEPGWKVDPTLPVTLGARLRRQADYVASLCGWEHVGIGSDLDGGFGLEESPQEIDSAADFARIGEVIPAEARSGVLGGNWLRFLRQSLPRSTAGYV